METSAESVPALQGLAAFALVAWSVALYMLAQCAEARIGARPAVQWQIPAVAGGTALLALAVRPLPQASLYAVVCSMLVIAADADARTGFIFDLLTLPTALATVLLVLTTGTEFSASLGVILLVGSFGASILVSHGRIMGLGDVKAMFSLGAAFGPLQATIAIFIACLSALIGTFFRGRSRHSSEIRFGPHLAIGACSVLIFGDQLAQRVIGL